MKSNSMKQVATMISQGNTPAINWNDSDTHSQQNAVFFGIVIVPIRLDQLYTVSGQANFNQRTLRKTPYKPL